MHDGEAGVQFEVGGETVQAHDVKELLDDRHDDEDVVIEDAISLGSRLDVDSGEGEGVAEDGYCGGRGCIPCGNGCRVDSAVSGIGDSKQCLHVAHYVAGSDGGIFGGVNHQGESRGGTV